MEIGIGIGANEVVNLLVRLHSRPRLQLSAAIRIEWTLCKYLAGHTNGLAQRYEIALSRQVVMIDNRRRHGVCRRQPDFAPAFRTQDANMRSEAVLGHQASSVVLHQGQHKAQLDVRLHTFGPAPDIAHRFHAGIRQWPGAE
ncbi:hypothetical protein D3C86_1598480 [compost metagenome]